MKNKDKRRSPQLTNKILTNKNLLDFLVDKYIIFNKTTFIRLDFNQSDLWGFVCSYRDQKISCLCHSNDKL